MNHDQSTRSTTAGKVRLMPVRFTPILVGALVGLFLASVLIDKVLPTWVPFVFSEFPLLFFGLFMGICGILGYIWALAEGLIPAGPPPERTRGRVINSIVTGMICGVFGAAVLYEKNSSGWIPGFLAGRPAVFFGLFIVVCGVLGYIWTLPDKNA